MNNLFERDDKGNIVATNPEEREYQRQLEIKHLMIRPSIVKGKAIVNGRYKDLKELTSDE